MVLRDVVHVAPIAREGLVTAVAGERYGDVLARHLRDEPRRQRRRVRQGLVEEPRQGLDHVVWVRRQGLRVMHGAEGARRAGLRFLVCAAESAPEAALAGVEPVAVRHLAEVVEYFRGHIGAPAFEPIDEHAIENGVVPDLADLRGQERARRALEIAAAGSHNLLLMGPPGTGKTMLARRLPGILPTLAREAQNGIRHTAALSTSFKTPLFTINPESGGLAAETQYLFLFTAVAVALIGPGRYAFNQK